jgi:hypothetical protein
MQKYQVNLAMAQSNHTIVALTLSTLCLRISNSHMPYENLDQMNLMVHPSCLPDHYSLRICLTPSAYLPLLHIFVMLRVDNSKPGTD